jgi:hypothetical protein
LSLLTRMRRLPDREPATPADDLTTDGEDAIEDSAAEGPTGESPAGEGRAGDRRRRARQVLAWTVTTLACLFVLLTLLLPNRITRITPATFLRIPIEGILGVAFLLLLHPRVRRPAAAVAGVCLGLLTIEKIIDIGFYASLDRPFNLVLDWVLFDDALGFLKDSLGGPGAIGAVVGVVVLVAALLTLATLSMLRLTSLVVRHQTTTIRTVSVLAVVWVVCAAFGAHLVHGVPIATRNTATLLKNRGHQVVDSLRDKETFAKESGVDKFRNTPGDQLLTGLRGKDVILTFVESYGRSAIENPQLAAQVDPVLEAGTRQLEAAGFHSRSAFLTSSTAGGGSWLAHSTLLSGLWINNQQRYRTLVSSDRLNLARCFGEAGWRTVSVEPDTTKSFPEGKSFYRYEQVYASRDLGYQGPRFSWSTMPDQYTLSAFQSREYAKPGRGPLFAEITLTSSHSPWAPIPKMLDWNALGDGSVFGPIADQGNSPTDVWKNRTWLRTEYARSVAYSVSSLVSYVEKYGDDNLVLVFLGDHQPAPIIVGDGASRDVPITIVAHDPAVLDRISGWHWQNGLKPGHDAPVWRMDTFRDKFLTAFGAPVAAR